MDEKEAEARPVMGTIFLVLSNLQYLDEMTPFHSLYRRTTSDKMEWLLELLEEVVWKWKAYDLIKCTAKYDGQNS